MIGVGVGVGVGVTHRRRSAGLSWSHAPAAKTP